MEQKMHKLYKHGTALIPQGERLTEYFPVVVEGLFCSQQRIISGSLLEHDDEDSVSTLRGLRTL